MRILLAVIFLAAAAWAGYWFIGSHAVESGLRGWLAAREAEGWVVHADDISTTGFPNRFDTTLNNLSLADPETGVAWSAPFFQILALSYKPHHVIAVWPDRQVVATPNEKITITSDTMRGSVLFEPGISLTLDHATIEFDGIGLVSTTGWLTSLRQGQLAVRQTPIAENSYDIAFDAHDLTLPSDVAGLLSDRGLVSDAVEHVSLRATVAFDAPWDRFAIEDRRPQPREIRLDLMRANWGDLELKIAGRLEVADDGTPSGSITVKAQNWREILRLANASGLVPDAIYPLAERGLAQIARLSGPPESLDVPLKIQGGLVMLGGFLPLGPAPRLILR